MITPGFTKDIGCWPWGEVTGYRTTGERIDAPRCDDLGFDVPEVNQGQSALPYDQSQIVDLAKCTLTLFPLEEYSKAGAQFTQHVADKPWGMREFGVRTVDGHWVMFGQEL